MSTPQSLVTPMSGMGLQRPFHLALMVCGHFTKKLLAENGTYVDMYRTWLQASLPKPSNIKFILHGYEALEQEYPSREELDKYDAILISGSPADAFGGDAWITRLMLFLQEVSLKHEKIKIFGSSFGHQIVCRALGATVEPNDGRWETGPTRVDTTYMGTLLFGVEDMTLMQFHQDQVLLTSQGDFFSTGELYLLGNSRRTNNQGIVKFYPFRATWSTWSTNPWKSDELVHRVQILTTQGHPEFTEKIVTEILRQRHEKGAITVDAYQEYFGAKGALSETEPAVKTDTGIRWRDHDDGVRVVGKTFWRMLGVDYGKENPLKIPISPFSPI